MARKRVDFRRTSLWPLAYMGVDPVSASLMLTYDRAPTAGDFYNYNIGTWWINRATAPIEEVWILVNKEHNTARWIKFLTAAGGIQTLTGNIGGAVSPDGAGNIDIIGAGPYIITGNPGTNTLTLSDDGTLALVYMADIGFATSLANVLNIVGGLNINSSAAGNTVTINTDNFGQGVLQADGAGVITGSVGTDGQVLISATGGIPTWQNITSAGGTVAVTNGPNSINLEALTTISSSYITDSGTAIPNILGELNILGGLNINSSAAGNTVTINTDNFGQGVLQADGAGVITGSVGTDGQVLISATGGVPTWQNITSAGGTIVVTNGPHSINLEAAAAGGVTAGDNINISGVNTVNLNETIHWPATNAAGTSGVIYLGGAAGAGGSRFMHNYGYDTTTTASNTFLGIDAGNFTMVVTGSPDAENNVGIGAGALTALTTGHANTSVGAGSLYRCTTGQFNTVVGDIACEYLTTGSYNTIVGGWGGQNLTTGNRNIFIGHTGGEFATDGTASDNIYIGSHTGGGAESKTIRIGNSAYQNKFFASGISTTPVSGRDVYVTVAADGQLGFYSSSIRYKDNIEDMGDYSSAIYKLRPRLFNYKFDETKKPTAGLIAEEVDDIFPHLVDRDPDGTIQALHYRELSILLLNEIQKLVKRVEDLEKRITLG